MTRAIDLHVHYAMHLRLTARPGDSRLRTSFNRVMFSAANRLVNAGARAVSAERAAAGGVSFGSVLYHPADEIFGARDGFATIAAQMEQVEADLASRGCRVVRSPTELADAVERGTTCAFHCIEGAYGLGDPCNVRALSERGTAYVTVAHLFHRGVSAAVNAFPFLTDRLYERLFPSPTEGLTRYGFDICEQMMDHGIVVDITHMSRGAIDQVAAMAAVKRRPLIASHAGIRATSSLDYLINMDDDTIRLIHTSGGVIGIIFARHWLRRPGHDTAEGVALVVRAMDHVRAVTGDCDTIAVGSDLDGFIPPADGLADIADVGLLERALYDRGYSSRDVEGILWRNALRALTCGWRAAPSRH